MADNEKGRREGDPIPNGVWRDIVESEASLHTRQARRLVRSHAVSFEMAARIVPFVFGEVAR
ncbi:hypothetical protein [Bradyrhizobium elkanii]